MSNIEIKCTEASKAVSPLLRGPKIPQELVTAWNHHNDCLEEFLASQAKRIAELEEALNAGQAAETLTKMQAHRCQLVTDNHGFPVGLQKPLNDCDDGEQLDLEQAIKEAG